VVFARTRPTSKFERALRAPARLTITSKVSQSAEPFDFDAVVVGAGAVGLACGYALACRGLSVAVLEKERAIGQGVSSRNSEVAHGGLYYPTGSLKARLCVEGRRRLYVFLDAHGVAYDRCGKLVVAVDDSEIPRLDAIARQAADNGVEGLARLDGGQARGLEPALNAVQALLSPQSGVFDSHGYMLALQGEIEDRGGAVVVETPFVGAEPLARGGFRIRAGGAQPTDLTCRLLVTAAGLGAQAAAAAIEGYPATAVPAAHFGKGVYFALHGPPPFSRLVYPLPIKGALGVHYRRDLGGQARFGPDLEYVAKADYAVDPAKAPAFAAYIRRFWPGLPDGALSPDYAGVRPKIHGPDEAQPDFRLDGPSVHGIEGLVAMFGIESPGLTSSLAIGEEAAAKLGV
jgi:L-2-hydroxyglutarate oxidase LhgO